MKMYTIGELSSLTDIPATTLRYYDQEGLLQPEIRNAANGYRYYSEKQLLQAEMIKELKIYGISIQDIQVILEKRDHNYLEEQLRLRVEALSHEVEQLNQQLLCTQYAHQRLLEGCNRLKAFSSQESEGKEPANLYQVEFYTMPDTWVLSTRYQSRIFADSFFINRSLELLSLRERYNLFPAGALLGIFHEGYAAQFTHESGDLELCMPVMVGKEQEAEDIPELKLMKGCTCVSTMHVGHYKFSYRAYLVLLEWIENSPYRITGPPMEIYVLDPGTCVNFDHFITRICFPIALKETGEQPMENPEEEESKTE